MIRRPGTAPSKASATTLCQKCLKRGHYSYECKASAQERPYKSRPSRTQQLLNPQLKPRLTTEVPNDLLRKKGVADDILQKKDEERGRITGRKRSRSRSRSSSADSVSTISTNRSPSRSPPPRRQKHDARGKRSRRSASMDSRSSLDSRPSGERDRERNTRRRRSSFSPEQRGRRGAPRDGSHPKRTPRSRSRSADRIETAADRPARGVSPPRQRSTSPRQAPPAGRNRFDERPAERGGHGAAPRQAPPPAPRERSLSPFSKRVALTRAMNAG